MIRLTVAQARTIVGHPEWLKTKAVQRASYLRNRLSRIAKARRHAVANTERRREIEQAYRGRNREKTRAAIARTRSQPGYRRAEKHARRGAAPDAEARTYMAVLLRDPCAYCGGSASEIDHIIPVAAGGRGDWANLTAACGTCNRRKGAQSLLLFVRAPHRGNFNHLHVGVTARG